MTSKSKNVLVTAAIIRVNDLFLLTQRPNNGSHPGKWEFPGGKVEEGEAPEEALIREIKEELDLEIAVGEIAAVITHKQGEVKGLGGLNIILLYYYCLLQGGTPQRIGCQDFQWVGLEELAGYDLAPADRRMVEKLLSFFIY